MISTFNGIRRTLGEGDEKEFKLLIAAELRDYLHLFKGSSLNVFMCIALHVDSLGWAWPSVTTIMRKTKRNDATVYRALALLYGLKIRGSRIMLRAQTPPPHVPPEHLPKKSPHNFYLIFPSAKEIEMYRDDGEPEATVSKKTSQNRGIKNETSQNRGINFARQRDTKSEDSPSTAFKEKTPHTQAPPPPARLAEPSLFQQAPAEAGGVGVPSQFNFEERLAWATSEASLPNSQIKDARSVAAARADGKADEQIALYYAAKNKPAPKRCDHTCPLCFGTGLEVAPGRGARACPRMNAAAQM